MNLEGPSTCARVYAVSNGNIEGLTGVLYESVNESFVYIKVTIYRDALTDFTLLS